MSQFKSSQVRTWNGFLKIRSQLDGPWLFKGHSDIWPLKTTLERACDFFEISFQKLPKIEKQIVRDFRRQYDGSDRELILADTLYCLALMQHHGAPTRLLDWTYSPYVAAFFALERSKNQCEIWCINDSWCTEESEEIVPGLKEREEDSNRTDDFFIPFFFDPDPPIKFVRPINPLPLLSNRRLIIQQGVFICPGDIRSSFDENLKALNGWDKENNVFRIHFKFTTNERNKALRELYRMNINRAALFPGIDGFAKSLKQKIALYGLLNK
jgi:hypothetical protein